MTGAPAPDGEGVVRRFRRDFREGLSYIVGERGLLFIMLYFMVSSFAGEGSETLYLPFFRSHPELFAAWPVPSVTLYTIVANFAVVGRLISGTVQYRVKLPPKKKFAIAFAVYLAISLLDGPRLYLPIPLIAASFLLSGLLGTTSYNIRIAATQSYIPDTKRARFNGTFTVMCSVGSIAGTFVAGLLAELISERPTVLLLNALSLGAVWLFMFRGRKDVAAIYNNDV